MTEFAELTACLGDEDAARALLRWADDLGTMVKPVNPRWKPSGKGCTGAALTAVTVVLPPRMLSWPCPPNPAVDAPRRPSRSSTGLWWMPQAQAQAHAAHGSCGPLTFRRTARRREDLLRSLLKAAAAKAQAGAPDTALAVGLSSSVTDGAPRSLTAHLIEQHRGRFAHTGRIAR